MRAIETLVVVTLLASKVTASTDGDASSEVCAGEKGDKVSGNTNLFHLHGMTRDGLQGGDRPSGIFWSESKYYCCAKRVKIKHERRCVGIQRRER